MPPVALRALYSRDYRLWAGAALGSNLGTWMQRTAQDWLVLTRLTAHSALALGLVTALQFAPQALLLPLTGPAADRSDRRRLLVVTQGLMGVLALTLAALVLTGAVRLWQVYGFCAAARHRRGLRCTRARGLCVGSRAAIRSAERGRPQCPLVQHGAALRTGPDGDPDRVLGDRARIFDQCRLVRPGPMCLACPAARRGARAYAPGSGGARIHRGPESHGPSPGPRRGLVDVRVDGGGRRQSPDPGLDHGHPGLSGAGRVLRSYCLTDGRRRGRWCVVGRGPGAATGGPVLGDRDVCARYHGRGSGPESGGVRPGAPDPGLCVTGIRHVCQQPPPVVGGTGNARPPVGVFDRRGLRGAPIVAPLFGWVADGFGPRFALAGIAVLAATAWSIGWRAGRAGIAGRSVPLAQAGEDRRPATSVASPAWAPED